MTILPIKRVVLYKNGVGFYERRLPFEGDEIELIFHSAEMNDVLKSLTIIDWGKGQILGLEYPTRQSKQELLQGCTVHVDDKRALRDLLVSLRGRRVRLLLGEPVRVANYPNQAPGISGKILGLDELEQDQALEAVRIAILRDNSAQVFSIELGRIGGVDILDERGAEDLRFYLQTEARLEEDCTIKIRLSAGEHDLGVSYLAPAPAWRVSYRLLADTATNGGVSRLMLLGLGIFDNHLEEDLNDVSLSFIAGMPISFIYDLYTPNIPERPFIGEEKCGQSQVLSMAGEGALPPAQERPRLAAAAMAAMPASALEKTLPAAAEGKDMGELFQYTVSAPVSVGRGQSAIVPILSANLPFRKELLFNFSRMEKNPLSSMRFKNGSGVVLERGPITVVEDGQYVGEAVLPYTPKDGDVIIPYAVELGVKVQSQFERSIETRGLGIKDGFLLVIEWEIHRRQYQINNDTDHEIVLSIEHARTPGFDLAEGIKEKERDATTFRFDVSVDAAKEKVFMVEERRLLSRREEIQKQSLAGLKKYLENGFMEKEVYDQLLELLGMWEKIGERESLQADLEKERLKIQRDQETLRNNLGALSKEGSEGELRAGFVTRLKESDLELEKLSQRERKLAAEIQRLKEEIHVRLRALERPA
jgi:hypothetical protein